ncbi:hypothetical protein F4825DRAFT_403671 [Nemania diffusa]|nr:hypothetical protein F4825DRAFT_403671 [Nemania diffusa]
MRTVVTTPATRSASSQICQIQKTEKYAPGFHAVHLGDTFDNGRYLVMHKLGASGLATVWLA